MRDWERTALSQAREMLLQSFDVRNRSLEILQRLVDGSPESTSFAAPRPATANAGEATYNSFPAHNQSANTASSSILAGAPGFMGRPRTAPSSVPPDITCGNHRPVAPLINLNDSATGTFMSQRIQAPVASSSVLRPVTAPAHAQTRSMPPPQPPRMPPCALVNESDLMEFSVNRNRVIRPDLDPSFRRYIAEQREAILRNNLSSSLSPPPNPHRNRPQTCQPTGNPPDNWLRAMVERVPRPAIPGPSRLVNENAMTASCGGVPDIGPPRFNSTMINQQLSPILPPTRPSANDGHTMNMNMSSMRCPSCRENIVFRHYIVPGHVGHELNTILEDEQMEALEHNAGDCQRQLPSNQTYNRGSGK